jgi:16S rRNA (cytosine967-C5)-methyltransferase
LGRDRRTRARADRLAARRGRNRSPSGGSGAAPPSARQIAARVLVRVEQDAAYAAAALDAELGRHPQLQSRDRALATELVYGCLRSRVALLDRLRRYASRGIDESDRLVTAHLVVAAYQLLVLERVPQFATVSSAVELVTRERGRRVGGFVNAVLRRLSSSGERLEWRAAVLESTPAWLRERLERAVGADEANALLGLGGARFETEAAPRPEPPAVAVRVIPDKPLPDWLRDAPRGRVLKEAKLLRRLGNPRHREGWARGAFVVQEEGAQVVAVALGARSGEQVLDACAGRGQKSSLLAGQVSTSGVLWSADLYAGKLRALGEEFERLGLPAPQTAAVDWTMGVGTVPGGFDRVLVDAPCSGVGTLRRRPDLVSRLDPGDPERLGELAARITRRAATRLRSGGRLVFAVCSVLPEECEHVVAALDDVLQPVPFDAPALTNPDPSCPDRQPAVDPGATSFRLLPLRHGTDGYFVASLIRRH